MYLHNNQEQQRFFFTLYFCLIPTIKRAYFILAKSDIFPFETFIQEEEEDGRWHRTSHEYS